MNEFAEVARMLAKDNQPEWLPMLAFWSPFVGYRKKLNKYDDVDNRNMIKSAERLHDELAIYARIEKEFGIEVPEEVDSASFALHELIEYLESEIPPARRGGPDPDGRRRMCAAVCGYIWRRSHDKVQPYFPPLQGACEAYWQACGHAETGKGGTGNLKNWEEFLEWARDHDATEFFAGHPLTPL
jgi:hypothetical protein